MIKEGQIVLFSFPNTVGLIGKLRPALILRQVPGNYNDWLICMISTQLHQKLPEIDEVLNNNDSDFMQTGLKKSSVIRITRIAIINADILKGSIGVLSKKRLFKIKTKLSEWIIGKNS